MCNEKSRYATFGPTNWKRSNVTKRCGASVDNYFVRNNTIRVTLKGRVMR